MQGNVGIAKGTALYRQTAGYSEFSWRGLCAGMTRPRDPSPGFDEADNAVTGVVEIVGGAMCVGGETSGHNDWSDATYGMFPSGTVVGYGGTAHPPASGRPYVGRMAISGTGSLTNRYGHLLVGVAPYGEGSLVLDGGTLRSTCEWLSGQNDYRERIACAVGVGGGKGEFLVRGGECSISNNVWIGGVATNAVRILATGSPSCRCPAILTARILPTWRRKSTWRQTPASTSSSTTTTIMAAGSRRRSRSSAASWGRATATA